jgi:hypothetical protein
MPISRPAGGVLESILTFAQSKQNKDLKKTDGTKKVRPHTQPCNTLFTPSSHHETSKKVPVFVRTAYGPVCPRPAYAPPPPRPRHVHAHALAPLASRSVATFPSPLTPRGHPAHPPIPPQARLTGIPKLDDANEAGGKNGSRCKGCERVQ